MSLPRSTMAPIASDSPAPLRRVPHRASRWALRLAVIPVALVASGLLLADRLTPRAVGAHSIALPPKAADTPLDREIVPLLAEHPGDTGVLVIPGGVDAFAARAMSARKAGRSLDLQYYMWHDDMTGRLLGREVYAAATRGVRVRILLDDMNAQGLDAKLLALDAHPNIEVRLYNPFRNRGGALRILEMLQRAFSITHRMHNKAWIADGHVAVVGGRNIGDEYFAAADDVNFRDLDLLLLGPAVQDASAVFDSFWNSDAVVPIAALNQTSARELAAMVHSADAASQQARARPYLARVATSTQLRDYYRRALAPQWTRGVRVLSDPPRKTAANESQWLVTRLVPLLAGASRKALIVSPYFVPGEAGARALADASRRGVFVAVATNSLAANDVPAVHVGYSRYRPALLDAGVALYEIKSDPDVPVAHGLGSSRASLHTKAISVDDRTGFVGSFNLDPRSINLNTEMGVLFDDAVLARRVRDQFVQLSQPDASYWTYLARDGEVHWLDSAGDRRVLTTEPKTSAAHRALVKVLGMLPIESQL